MVYHQNSSNNFSFGSLASTFTASGEEKSARAIAMRIYESLNCQSQYYKDSIVFDNAIISDQLKKLVEQRLRYKINK